LTIVPLGRAQALGRRRLFGLQHGVETLSEFKCGLAVWATPDVTTVRLHEPYFGGLDSAKDNHLIIAINGTEVSPTGGGTW
jgi:hypothetical protein